MQYSCLRAVTRTVDKVMNSFIAFYNIFVLKKMMSKTEAMKADIKEARNAAYLGKYQQSLKLFKAVIDSIEQEIILNNIPKADVEVWRQVESNVIQEKNSVEGLIYMLSGLSNRSTLTYTKPRDSYDQSK